MGNADGRWTADDIPDLTGKVAVVTGANSGIGFEAAKELARKGAETVLACRSPERGQRALDALQAEVPDAQAALMALDLGSLAAIEEFANAFRERYERLDILANNAGIMVIPYAKTVDGFERQVGTNHLGHFALTGHLLDRITATPTARVVNVSSLGHVRGSIDFENLLYERGGYGEWAAYFRSKLANMLFTYELQRRFEAAGVEASALAAHPGFARSNLATHIGARWVAPLQRVVLALVSQSAAMGALPTLRAATDAGARGGQYFGPRGFMGQRGYPALAESSDASRRPDDARRLWEASEALTGVRYERLRPAGEG